MAPSISQVGATSGAENTWQRWAAPVLFKKQHQPQPSTAPASAFHTPWNRCSWLGSLLGHWQLYSQRLVISHLISLQPPYLVYILIQSTGKRGFIIALNAFLIAASKLFRNFFWYYHYLWFSVLPQNYSISQLRLLGRIRKQMCILGWQNWKSFCFLPLWVTVTAFAFKKFSQFSHFSIRVTFCSKMPGNKCYWGRRMRW